MKEIEEIPAYLPSGAALRDSVQRARDWLQDVEALQVGVRKRMPGCQSVRQEPELDSGRVYVGSHCTERPFLGGRLAHSVPSRPHLEVLVHLWPEQSAQALKAAHCSRVPG